MSSTTINSNELKALLKQALVELLEEKKQILYDALAEVVEEVGLVRTIQEGQAGENSEQSEGTRCSGVIWRLRQP